MGLATDIATKSSSPVPLGRMAEGLYKEAIEAEPKLAGKDFSSIYNYLKGHVN
jgi:3-hydroxyisobutyrate dehydrogenase